MEFFKLVKQFDRKRSKMNMEGIMRIVAGSLKKKSPKHKKGAIRC